MLRPKLFASIVCLALAACGPAAPEVPADFGAENVAKWLVSARKACGLIHADDLDSCAGEKTHREAWIAATTAKDLQHIYFSNCADSLGMQKCEDMLSAAFLDAIARVGS
jgi:hypothetical protein